VASGSAEPPARGRPISRPGSTVRSRRSRGYRRRPGRARLHDDVYSPVRGFIADQAWVG